MQWLNTIVDELIAKHPEGEILVESGGSPSGTHHLGHMREFVTSDAITLELRRRGREAKHIYFTDDLDAFRKVPADIPENFKDYLGMPLCDVPSPDGSDISYADFFLAQLQRATTLLGVDVEFLRAHEKYRQGFFVPAIERCLERLVQARQTLETVSGRQLDNRWSPIQIMENGRLKNRKFVSINNEDKTIAYEDNEGVIQNVKYDAGEVKLDWRLDWPGRWWLLGINAEPFGQDHASAGGSYDTGLQIMRDVYEAAAPYPVPYEFINLAGDTKKMSASKGTGLDAEEGATIMPPEVVRYFILRFAPSKRLYFDPVNGVVQLMDEFAALSAKTDRTESEDQLLYICTRDLDSRTVSRVPFSHLVASYQSALKDVDNTIAVIARTEHAEVAKEEADIIRAELKFIDEWLQRRAPEDVKFELQESVDVAAFSSAETTFFARLADKIANAPIDADGAWFHNAIYEFKDDSGLGPKELFQALYRLTIAKTSGPRAGWFLSILPRDWLVARLRLEK